jgi:hypothetical protein
MKPSGMEKATDRPEGGAQRDEDGAPKRRRGPGVSTLSIDRTETLSVEAPAGSRHKGFEDIIVQDLMLKAETTRYRRERWETPDGERLIASLPAGIVGGCGPHLHRLVLMLHFQGQMTCERIVALLTGLGLAISKRQVVRLVTARLDSFRAEDEAALRAGLAGAPFITVDDTGAPFWFANFFAWLCKFIGLGMSLRPPLDGEKARPRRAAQKPGSSQSQRAVHCG